MVITGRATKEGTSRYINRFPIALENSAYRRFRRMRISSVGIGTYLGAATEEDDKAYATAISRALLSGCNLIDTASNDRSMRSERVIGRVLGELISGGKLQRDEIWIATKGGYLPFDCEAGCSEPETYWDARYFSKGKLTRDDVIDLQHSLDPDFINGEIEQSLKNLNLECVDIYYLHNPEIHLQRLKPADFYQRLSAVFKVLEEAVKAGKIGCYGISTWNGFRVDDRAPESLSLPEVIKAARSAGGDEHNFALVQLPLNLSKTEAVALSKQVLPGKTHKVTMVQAAAELGIWLVASATLDQGKLTKFLPAVVKQYFKKVGSDTQLAVQFARSCTAVTSALVGMRSAPHVDEVLGVFKHQPEAPENFVRLFESPDRSLVR